MVDEQMTNGWSIGRFYSNIVLDWTKTFGVYYIIDEHTTNESFTGARFYWNIVVNLKQRFEVDYIIHEHTTNE